MSVDMRAYDNEHGDPVVVLVTTGTYDVSRLVALLSGGRCEDQDTARRLREMVRRGNGGRAALRLLREQERSIDKNDRAALHRADMRFHSGLMRAFAVERAWTACLHVSADMMRVQFLIGMRRDHIEAIVEEHKGVLAAVRAGDPALASARLAAHIRNVDIDQADLKALNADYFRLSEEI